MNGACADQQSLPSLENSSQRMEEGGFPTWSFAFLLLAVLSVLLRGIFALKNDVMLFCKAWRSPEPELDVVVPPPPPPHPQPQQQQQQQQQGQQQQRQQEDLGGVVQDDVQRTERLARAPHPLPKQIAVTRTGGKYHSPLCGSLIHKTGVEYVTPCLSCTPLMYVPLQRVFHNGPEVPLRHDD